MMDADQRIRVPLGSVVRQMTMVVDIDGARTWSLRLRIATWLIRLAARVIGCGIRIDVGTKGDDE